MPTARHLPPLLLLLAVPLLLFDYPAMWQLPPGAIHVWRQVDVLSLIDCYAAGAPLWQPQTWNQFAGDPLVVSELPLLYWLVAQLPTPAEPTYRILVSLHLYSLLVALYSCGWQLTRSRLWATLPPLILLSLPVWAYYGANYLPEVVAMGYAGWGLAAWLWWHHTGRGRWAMATALAMGGLFKVTALLPWCAILYALGYSWLQAPSKRAWWQQHRTLALPMALPMALNLAWWMLARAYGHLHSPYFVLSTLPIWASPDVLAELQQMVLNWGSLYAHKAMALLLAGLGLATLLRGRGPNPALPLLAGYSLAAAAVFVLMYSGFVPHDYFMLPLLLALPMAAMAAGSEVRHRPWGRWVALLLVVATALHLGYARHQLWHNYYAAHRYSPSPTLRSAPFRQLLDAHVPHRALVLSVPDPTPNMTLYELKRRGYTDFTWHGQQVDYVVLHQADSLARYSRWCGQRVFTYREITVYRARSK